jgi:hypothetical protein
LGFDGASPRNCFRGNAACDYEKPSLPALCKNEQASKNKKSIREEETFGAPILHSAG